MFGLSGASRTGKSTVCKLVSERTGIPFHTFNTAEIMRERDFNVVGPMSFPDRLAAQEAYLDHYEETIATLPRPCITDRTPICLAGYLLSEITMTNPHPELGERVKAYLDRAVAITEGSFGTVFFLRPLDTYEAAPGKAAPNLGYQWHNQVTMEGIADLVKRVPIGRIRSTDLETRVSLVIDQIVKRMEQLQRERDASSVQ